MTHAQTLARFRYLLQVGFVVIVTSAFVLLTDHLSFRSEVNLVWMIALPFIVGMIANVGWGRRCFMAIALIGVSIAVSIFVGVNFTSYG